jgi:hypothetical protein
MGLFSPITTTMTTFISPHPSPSSSSVSSRSITTTTSIFFVAAQMIESAPRNTRRLTRLRDRKIFKILQNGDDDDGDGDDSNNEGGGTKTTITGVSGLMNARNFVRTKKLRPSSKDGQTIKYANKLIKEDVMEKMMIMNVFNEGEEGETEDGTEDGYVDILDDKEQHYLVLSSMHYSYSMSMPKENDLPPPDCCL